MGSLVDKLECFIVCRVIEDGSMCLAGGIRGMVFLW